MKIQLKNGDTVFLIKDGAILKTAVINIMPLSRCSDRLVELRIEGLDKCGVVIEREVKKLNGEFFVNWKK